MLIYCNLERQRSTTYLKPWSRHGAGGRVRWPTSPDPSRGACFLLRGPDSSSGALIRLSGIWSVPRGPDTSRGALIRIWEPCRSVKAGPLPDPRGPDSSSGALLCPVGPNLSQWALIHPSGPWSVRRSPGPSHEALIHPAGPWRGSGPSRRGPYLTHEVPIPPPGP